MNAGHPELPTRRQCELPGLPASSLYYHRVPVDPEDLVIMGLIDRQYFGIVVLRGVAYDGMAAIAKRAGVGCSDRLALLPVMQKEPV